MTTTPTPRQIADIHAELDAINGRLLDAMARYVRERSKESFDEWLAINREYVATHRRWWALASPDVPYESVFGATVP